jgi:hypothetical protein
MTHVGRRPPRVQRFDIMTPTEREARDADIARRKKGYFLVWVPCLLLVVFGFFVPAPTPLRIAALVIAAPLLPIAAIVANTQNRR